MSLLHNGIFFGEDDTVVIYHHGTLRDISHLDEEEREREIAKFRELRAAERAKASQ